MFTPDRLLDIAIEADAAYHAATSRDVRMDAYIRRDNAMGCAEWMDAKGISELPCVGPFGGEIFKRGDKIRIRKGAAIRSMGKVKNKVAGRDYTVVVHHFYPGVIFRHYNEIVVRAPQVEWAGQR